MAKAAAKSAKDKEPKAPKEPKEKKEKGKKYLVIVESPAKAKTIKKILGDSYFIKASVGHIRDLPKKTLGVDVKNNFEPEYEILENKKKVVDDLNQAAKEADEVFLAPDPDREGEAIAWHIASILDKPKKHIHRIEFNEITKTAIQEAVLSPRPINMNTVNAQQTRRILDRLVGYKISPLLWSKVGKGLSAGRVQSVAVKIICDREKEIEAFVAEEYWTISAELSKQKSSTSFNAELTKYNGEKLEIKNGDESDKIVEILSKPSTEFRVSKVTTRNTQRKPQAPFITSTLQREASNKLGYGVKKTMQVAQKLYEGIDLGSSGPVGLITYMRTDSTRIADEARDAAKEYIVEHYGAKYYPEEARVYAKKGKQNVQDAHEAIRPSYIDKNPESVRQYLAPDQYRLYKLIWERFIASQMQSAEVKTISAEIEAAKYTFRASSSKVTFDGFLIVYDDREEEEKTDAIPDLNKDDVLKLKKIDPKQHFTQPPPRYSEATLIKILEELGVGRPSTYAPTISTIQDRGYIIKEEKSLVPTLLGKAVNELLVKHFPEIVDSQFTANMETSLDNIAENNAEWKKILGDFYEPFAEVLKKAKKEMEKVAILTENICSDCGKPMALKTTFNSQFLGCSGYPECKNTMPLAKDQKPLPEDRPSDELCEKCNSSMLIKRGPYGDYLSCTNGECKHRKKYIIKTGVKCPQPECEGELIEKKSRYGKAFYGCDKYPACTFALWSPPSGEKCPECGSMLVKKYLKRGNKIACSKKECAFEKPMTD